MVRVKNYKTTSKFVKVNAEKTVYRLTLFTLFHAVLKFAPLLIQFGDICK